MRRGSGFAPPAAAAAGFGAGLGLATAELDAEARIGGRWRRVVGVGVRWGEMGSERERELGEGWRWRWRCRRWPWEVGSGRAGRWETASRRLSIGGGGERPS
jgi:hypothetical protein